LHLDLRNFFVPVCQPIFFVTSFSACRCGTKSSAVVSFSYSAHKVKVRSFIFNPHFNGGVYAAVRTIFQRCQESRAKFLAMGCSSSAWTLSLLSSSARLVRDSRFSSR
jgi:hypothetical protein